MMVPLLVTFAPLKSTLVRLASLKSIVASPKAPAEAVSSEPLRSTLARLASAKSIVASPP